MGNRLFGWLRPGNPDDSHEALGSDFVPTVHTPRVEGGAVAPSALSLAHQADGLWVDDDAPSDIMDSRPLYGQQRRFVLPDGQAEAEAQFQLLAPPAAGLDSQNPLEAMPTIGQVGRYALKLPLGTGGMGQVFAAWDPLLSRMVAVKTLQFDMPPELRESLTSLILREARAAASLNHAYIVTVFDAGLSERGVYMAMERLRGRDLRHALSAGWLPSARRAAVLVRRVADALAYAHGRGVIHCDIKPANIFLVGRAQPKVLDFGIARVASGAAASALEGALAGSPYYQAPEQIRNETVDSRTDLYALGVVLYELLTGRRAFNGNSVAEIQAAVLNQPPPPAHEVRPEVPVELSEIAARAMAAAPRDRYISAIEMSLVLRHWADEQAAAGASRKLAAPPNPSPAPLVLPAPAAKRSGRAAWAVVTLAVVGAAALVAWKAQSHAQTGLGSAALSPVTTTTTTTTTAAGPEAKTDTALPASPALHGNVQLLIEPWGRVEVNGSLVGTTPPMAQLRLPVGTHTITVRHEELEPFVTEVQVSADRPVTLSHSFQPPGLESISE